MTPEQIKDAVCLAASGKKAKDIVILDVKNISSIADYFVICSGRSNTQVKAVAENIDDEISKNYSLEPLRREGVAEGKWAVIDYGGVIVHIFLEDVRTLYNLDALWLSGDNKTEYLYEE